MKGMLGMILVILTFFSKGDKIMARYNLRSRKTGPASSPSPAKVQARLEAEILSPEPAMAAALSKSEPPAKRSRVSLCRRKVKIKKSFQRRTSSCTIYHLPQGMDHKLLLG